MSSVMPILSDLQNRNIVYDADKLKL